MIGVVIGTRPELIKLRPICYGLRNLDVPVKIIYTEQHEAIRQEVGALATEMHGHRQCVWVDPLSGWEWKPTAIVVQGDTDSARKWALDAAFRQIPVIHVEAGLRTVTDRRIPIPDRMPFPEELNRQLISRAASLHLAPTYGNEQTLYAERVGGRIVLTGNPGVTALHEQLEQAPNVIAQDSILVTCHRRENWPHIDQLVHELDVVRYQSKHWIVFVKHPNTALYRNVAFGPGFTVSDSLTHNDLIQDLLAAKLVVTDSGGLIEEATWLRKRKLCLRTETERPEAQAPLIKSIMGCHRDILAALEQPEPSEGSRYAFGDERSASKCALAIEAFYKEL